VNNKNVYVTIRLPKRVVEKIDKLVENGNFMSRSSFVRYAVMVVLDNYDL